jgi:hypothetical protein
MFFFKNQKYEPNIVEVTHLCIMHRVHTSSIKLQLKISKRLGYTLGSLMNTIAWR